MSHFSVLVRISGSVARNDIERAVGEALDPYCEHTDNGRLDRFMVFEDEEAEHLKQYETESTEMIRVEDGSLVLPWDDRFRVAGTLGIGTNSHEPPAHLERVQVPHKEKFATFEQFMADWCGYKARDEKHGKYGHYRNPRAKWDYWRLGGRWRGRMLIKEPSRVRLVEVDAPGGGLPQEEAGLGPVSYEWDFHARHGGEGKDPPLPGGPTEVDFCRIEHLDFDRIERETTARVAKFWAELDQWFSGKKFDHFDGPRGDMLDVGILECIDGKDLKGDELWKEKWSRPGVDRYDVIRVKPDPTALDARLRNKLCPIRPWAFVDKDGWREKGRMGWFGTGSDTPESNEQHGVAFMQWIKSGDQRDWIVMVDCHV